ncbi:unnamed protein product [Ectocarpus sp. CCAP 1310/34]|nr:unnamed protein product [Ectocarpus sp. CCAP 1310/34]
MWLATQTRPDIANAVRAARYCASPKMVHWKAALGILGYVRRTSWMGITFERGVVTGMSMQVFVDADYASKAADRRSVSGGLVMCGGGCVTWFSRTQKCVTLSTTEAEYVAIADVLKEVLFLRQVWRFMLPDAAAECALVLICSSNGTQRLARWFHELLNTKSPTINLHAANKVKRWPTYVPLDDIPSLLEVEEVVREMANRKAVGPDDLTAELIKLFLDGDQGCEETIEATVRKRRLCFAGFVMRMEDSRLPKRMLLGAMAGGVGYRGGQESDWVSRLGEDLVAFNMGDEKEGGKWKESAKDPEVWYNKVKDGAARFMRKWHRQEAEVFSFSEWG